MKTDELLDFRKDCKGKGTMYIIIPNGSEFMVRQNIHIATPRQIFTSEELDDFIKFLLDNSTFDGLIPDGSEHPIWTDLVKDSRKKRYYRFLLEDSWIEICPVALRNITYKSPSEKT